MKNLLSFEQFNENYTYFNENYTYYLEDDNKVVQVSKDEFIQKFGTTYEPRKSANGKGFALKIENDKVFGTIQ